MTETLIEHVARHTLTMTFSQSSGLALSNRKDVKRCY